MSDEEVLLKQMLTKEKPCMFLVEVYRKNQAFSNGDAYASAISEEIDATYSHTTRTAQKFVNAGLLEKEKDGRKEVLTLTDEGEKVAKSVSEFYNTLDEVGDTSQ